MARLKLASSSTIAMVRLLGGMSRVNYHPLSQPRCHSDIVPSGKPRNSQAERLCTAFQRRVLPISAAPDATLRSLDLAGLRRGLARQYLWVAIKAGRRQGARRGAYINRYATDEQRS